MSNEVGELIVHVSSDDDVSQARQAGEMRGRTCVILTAMERLVENIPGTTSVTKGTLTDSVCC